MFKRKTEVVFSDLPIIFCEPPLTKKQRHVLDNLELIKELQDKAKELYLKGYYKECTQMLEFIKERFDMVSLIINTKDEE